ncbi:MAG: 1-acyl-sn-glycerol-3-phosphate acyltransferase [Opitutae bacterium]|nr:1-acyl-sn-glycerol-3-phosphate acyltransferase [Opitutae bacterium]
MTLLERCVRLPAEALVRFLLGAYFRRIEVFHADRVPAGPVLFVANHPGSVTDAFVVTAALPRRANFLATAVLFRFPPLGWLLRRLGVIPLNRTQDDPHAMHTVADSFAAAFRALGAGQAIVIFPEGITYEDARLKALKSGAARLALEFEARPGGAGGLQIVPLGLTYSAKDRYRSEVLVYFGEPIRVANFLPQYAERRKECIRGLTAKIERRLQSLLVHLPQMELEHMVAAVKRLYLAKLRLGNLVITAPVSALTEEVLLTQTIVDACAYAHREMPEHAQAFFVHLHRYERTLRQLHLADEDIEALTAHRHATARVFGLGLAAIVLFPVAFVGWLHWRPASWLLDAVAGRVVEVPKRKAQLAHVRMLVGLVIFGGFFAAYAALGYLWLGWPHAGWYALLLPVTGLIGHYYRLEIGRLFSAARTTVVLFRAPFAKRRILKMRAAALREIEIVRKAYRQTLTAGVVPGRTESE